MLLEGHYCCELKIEMTLLILMELCFLTSNACELCLACLVSKIDLLSTAPGLCKVLDLKKVHDRRLGLAQKPFQILDCQENP